MKKLSLAKLKQKKLNLGPDTSATKSVFFNIYILVLSRRCDFFLFFFFLKMVILMKKNDIPFKNFTLKLSVFTFSSLLPPSLLPPFFVQMERI